MTGPAVPSGDQALPDLFVADAEAAVLHVLRTAGVAMSATEIKQTARAAGVAKDAADRAWRRVRNRIMANDQVLVEAKRYRWAPRPRDIAAVEAAELLAKGGLTSRRKGELIDIVRRAVKQSTGAAQSTEAAQSTDAIQPAATQVADKPAPVADLEAAARQRQKDIDAVRALAELAAEVEELTANEASAQAMVHRVRSRVHRSGLEPIERAGVETTYDRTRHRPIGPPIRDGSPVIVVRPGYVWKAPSEDVLIDKAFVEE